MFEYELIYANSNMLFFKFSIYITLVSKAYTYFGTNVRQTILFFFDSTIISYNDEHPFMYLCCDDCQGNAYIGIYVPQLNAFISVKVWLTWND